MKVFISGLLVVMIGGITAGCGPKEESVSPPMGTAAPVAGEAGVSNTAPATGTAPAPIAPAPVSAGNGSMSEAKQ